MKLQQLRYAYAIARHGLNISAAAKRSFASQPSVSRQLRLLEDELGVRFFERNGKRMTAVTPVGKKLLECIEEILLQTENLHRIAGESKNETSGSLSVATTHTQARYRLPAVIKSFIRRYPKVSLHLHQGTPMQIARLASEEKVDFAIATEALELFDKLIMMPCYRWNRSIVVPLRHPLTRVGKLSLREIAKHPLITYVFGFTGGSQLNAAFRRARLAPNVVFTATDADVIKTYVKLGLGVGIIARMAYDPKTDGELRSLDVSALFPPSVTKIGFRRGTYLRQYMYDFISLFAPHLTREVVDKACASRGKEDLDELFSSCELPYI